MKFVCNFHYIKHLNSISHNVRRLCEVREIEGQNSQLSPRLAKPLLFLRIYKICQNKMDFADYFEKTSKLYSQPAFCKTDVVRRSLSNIIRDQKM